MSVRPFLRLNTTKICFLPEHDTLFKKYFLPYQQFNVKIRLIAELYTYRKEAKNKTEHQSIKMCLI